ncbi:FAD-binding protein [Thermosipho melanesiensis]|uniref:Molybdopterin dehydrogenase, FAD-binding n=2 Tax=Thermosipho melanesiensis TaxID=46541 RepID=A6LML9_THEM4|nr:FAD binding domain-containing protein [Thermosipho melanesiensis]ABR31170.1 molybdopterin dehydrogenase, FAD-binding [Thermosipho melanesiensis BI429]APT74259.1 FAD-binding protein [Thermosipho melanesiensis]OOC36199.1 FAD-binding protein [Thermosipho melanesiensis]OOC37017.1 FAD-binding protein [Thermosipho melanesiensis]OOC37769.1 FAD-binding protein [Thermosipho melanesiensis]
MIYFKEYAKPKIIEEAYEILTSKNAKIIGGATFLKLSNQSFDVAIDLIDANLNFVNETETEVEIGSTVTLSKFEENPILSSFYNGFLKNITKDILNLQMRNIITIGGTIFPKLGFSDLITGLLVLDTEIYLFKNGKISLEKFLKTTIKKDIIEKIVIKKENLKTSFENIRFSEYDFSILNVAVSKSNNTLKIAIGSRPSVATLIKKPLEYFSNLEIDKLLENVNFSDDIRATKVYRKKVCKVLLKRALKEVL